MITVFTDGSCNHNQREVSNTGGYAYVVLNESGTKIREFVGKETNTTNNRMELSAVIQALKDLKNIKEEITINSDSQYVVNAINQKWIYNWQRFDFRKGKFNKEIPNADLWREMFSQLRPNIKFKWVKGHLNQNTWNDYIDNLVRKVYQRNFTVIN